MRLGDLAKTTQPWPDAVDTKAWGIANHHTPDLLNIFDHGSLSFVTPVIIQRADSYSFTHSFFLQISMPSTGLGVGDDNAHQIWLLTLDLKG